MMKSFRNSLLGEKFKIAKPKSSQECIPIKRIYKDGIWQIGNKFSKTYAFTDINYAVASEADQQEMYMDYEGVINAFSPSCTYKITIQNFRNNISSIQKHLLMEQKSDGFQQKEALDTALATGITQNVEDCSRTCSLDFA